MSDDDDLYETADPAEGRALEEATKSRLKAVASSQSGRWFFARLIRASRRRCFCGQSLTTAYNQGYADLARSLVDELRVSDLELFQSIERQMAQGEI